MTDQPTSVAEVFAAAIDTFMRAMQSEFFGGDNWDEYTIKFSARRRNEATEIRRLSIVREPPK